MLENLAENLVKYLWQLPSKGNAASEKSRQPSGLCHLLIYAVRRGTFFYAHTRILRGENLATHAFHVNIWSSEAADNCCPCAMPAARNVPSNREAKGKARAAGQQISLEWNASINFYFCYQLFARRRQRSRSQLKSVRLSVHLILFVPVYFRTEICGVPISLFFKREIFQVFTFDVALRWH